MLRDSYAHPVLPASDMTRARNFYEKVLGFEPIMEAPFGVIYKARGSVVFLYPSQYAGTNQATAAGFIVDDLVRLVKDLRGRGVRFEQYDMPEMHFEDGISHDPNGGLSAWFKDTEGNTIALAQPVEPIAWPRESVAAGHRAG